jgi:hypothetical protein
MFVEGGLQFFNGGLKLCGVFGVHAFRAQFANAIFQSAGGHGTGTEVSNIFVKKA